jgi:hypothetical protein
VGPEPVEYCREIEIYLCRKNDGHLIRVVGPSFELVSRWATDGVPLKIAFEGIDRYFDRYYRKGPRRRPVRIDFCEADVRDVFDEWRRAVGLSPAGIASDSTAEGEEEGRRGPSLPAHLERAALRLTNARATGALGARSAELDEMIDRVSRELDAARVASRGIRGDARRDLIARLAALDAELLRLARSALDAGAEGLLEREAQQELAGFRERMTPDSYRRAREAAVDRLARERLGLPTLTYS